MFRLIRTLLSKASPPAPVAVSADYSAALPAFDVQGAAEALVRKLRRCTRRVVIAGPQRGETSYRGDVVADAVHLLAWVQRRTVHKIVVGDDEKVSAAALPMWFETACLEDDAIAVLPKVFRSIWTHDVEDLLREGIARAFCPACRCFVADVRFAVEDKEDTLPRLRWTDSWYCPQGHLLYQEREEMWVCGRRGG